MFQGASSLSLDAKGRLSMPTRHRDVLAATASNQLTITKHPHGCLMIFPRPEWEKFRDRIAQLPMAAQWWKRIFLGNAMDVELDSTGRVLVSPELRTAAGIEKDVILLGQKNRGITEIFQLVQTYPQHPQFKEWVKALRDLLKPAPAPTPGEAAPAEAAAPATTETTTPPAAPGTSP